MFHPNFDPIGDENKALRAELSQAKAQAANTLKIAEARERQRKLAEDQYEAELSRLQALAQAQGRVVEAARRYVCAGEHDGYCDPQEIALKAALSSLPAAEEKKHDSKS